jgi:hypothetical protein
MSKRLITVLAIAFLVAGVACAAYAEVQNVKVSGDMTFLGVSRQNFGLEKGPEGSKVADKEEFFSTQTRLRIDADLTDNVMTTIRLINERGWNYEGYNDTSIDVDLAYITLKEFLYSPLSLTIGRQELAYGNKLIIGSANSYSDSVLHQIPSDLGMRKSFDAIKAVLNYDPLVIDVFYSYLWSNLDDTYRAFGLGDKVRARGQLAGINAAWKVDKNTDLEGYLFAISDRQDNSDKPEKMYTIGALIKNTSIKDTTLSFEAAKQFGKAGIVSFDDKQVTREGYALQGTVGYAFTQDKVKKYMPMGSVTWTYLSGDTKDDGKSKSWNSMFYDQALNNITYAILPFSNLNVINVKGSFKPGDDVILKANMGFYNKAAKKAYGLGGRDYLDSNKVDSNGDSYEFPLAEGKSYLGTALDLTAIYDYTEDVQIGLTWGMFVPGNALDKNEFDSGKRATATQAIASMKVTF